MNDKEIIQLLREGRMESAFKGIVAHYSEALYWHIRRFTISHDDADDILQDTFIKMWKSLPSFHEECKLFTWVWRIATNESLNFVRRQKLRSMMSLEDYSEIIAARMDDDPSFDGDALQRELYKAMAKLPPKQQMVFSMRYFDEMKYEDISQVLGTSVGALKASYHHAYNKIKDELTRTY